MKAQLAHVIITFFVAFLTSCHDKMSPSMTDSMPNSSMNKDAGLDVSIDQSDAGSSDRCTADSVQTISGIALSDTRQPLKEAKAQACVILESGQWLCLSPTLSNEQGAWSVELPAEYQCLQRLALRLVANDGSSSTYCATLESELNHNFGQMILPDLAVGWTESDAETESSLTQYELEADESVLLHPQGLKLAVSDQMMKMLLLEEGAVSSLKDRNDCLSQSHDFDYTFAMTPEGFSQDTRLLYVPTPELNEGQTVELYLVGGLYSELEDGSIIEEGASHLAYQGQVFEGGIHPNINLPFLTWLGLKVLQ